MLFKNSKKSLIGFTYGNNYRLDKNKGKSSVLKTSINKLMIASLSLLLIVSSVQADKATINQKETDIGVFIEMVSRLTGKTFIVDPRVRNKKITVISQHEMDEEEIFSLFLSVLKVHQFSAVEAGPASHDS